MRSEASWAFRPPTTRPYLATIAVNGTVVYSGHYENASEAWESLSAVVSTDACRASLLETEALLYALGGSTGMIEHLSTEGDVLKTMALTVQWEEELW